MEQIKKLRKQIDGIDRKIVNLIEKRISIAKEIGGIKKREGMEIKDPVREEEVFRNVSKTSLDNKFVKKIYKEIIDYCKSEEERG